MNLKGSLKFCKHLGYRVAWQAKKHAPAICLAIAGVAGVGCVVTACKATTKLEPILEHHNKVLAETKEIIAKDPDKFSPKQQRRMVGSVYAHTVVRVVDLYKVPIALGVTAGVSALTGYDILNKRNAYLAGALSIAEQKLAAYQNEQIKRAEALTEHVEEQAEEAVAKQQSDKPVANDLFRYVWTYGDKDFSDPRMVGPYANAKVFRQKEAYLNELLPIHGAITINDMLMLFGKEVEMEGQCAGWIYDPKKGDHQIDLGLDNPKNRQFVQGSDPDAAYILPNCDTYILDKMISAKREMWEFYNRGPGSKVLPHKKADALQQIAECKYKSSEVTKCVN